MCGSTTTTCWCSPPCCASASTASSARRGEGRGGEGAEAGCGRRIGRAKAVAGACKPGCAHSGWAGGELRFCHLVHPPPMCRGCVNAWAAHMVLT